MFFPYKDENPRVLVPYVTYGILGLNILIFLYQTLITSSLTQHAFTLRYGMIPAYFWQNNASEVLRSTTEMMSQYAPQVSWHALTGIELLPPVITLLTAPFLHSGWLHLGGNMLFLYVFADNVEGALGHRKFAFFYLLTAVFAGLSHLVMVPDSIIPVVGASGAISGVLGAYMVRYPKARIHVFVFVLIFFTTIRMPALMVLGLWFLVQATYGFLSLGEQVGGGIAWFEHIGGFLVGLIFMGIIKARSKFKASS